VTPHVLGLGVPELLITLTVVLLFFGGSRLAGLGKSTRRALMEFKEETNGLRPDDSQPPNRWTWGAYPDRNRLSAATAGQRNRRGRPAAAPTSRRHGPAKDLSGTDLRNDA